MKLQRFNVTVRRFDSTTVGDAGEVFVLPVDSPDAEHAISAAMSNAVAFTKTVEGRNPLPIAFRCEAVSERSKK